MLEGKKLKPRSHVVPVLVGYRRTYILNNILWWPLPLTLGQLPRLVVEASILMASRGNSTRIVFVIGCNRQRFFVYIISIGLTKTRVKVMKIIRKKTCF